MVCRRQFLSTPSARRATVQLVLDFTILWISIHALREEGDLPMRAYAMIWQISIHALREEGDRFNHDLGDIPGKFLSTPSARRATLLLKRTMSSCRNFYPRPPRGGRRNTAYQRSMADIFLSTPSARRATQQDAAMKYNSAISIHALREEGDLVHLFPAASESDFYPRPPRGGRLSSSMVQM